MMLPSVARSASAWVAVASLPGSLAPNEAAWLQRLGFVGGVQERLAGTFASTAEVYAAVEQFRSVAAARAELRHSYLKARTIPGLSLAPFPVADIPQSVGYDSPTGGADHTITFAAGHFMYLMSSLAPAGARGAPTRAQVITAATAWWRRLRAGNSQPGGTYR